MSGFEEYLKKAESSQPLPPTTPLAFAREKLEQQEREYLDTYNREENKLFRQILAQTAAYLVEQQVPVQNHYLVEPNGGPRGRWGIHNGTSPIGVDGSGWHLYSLRPHTPIEVNGTWLSTPSQVFLRADGQAIIHNGADSLLAVPVTDRYFGNEAQGLNSTNHLQYTQVLNYQDRLYATQTSSGWDRGWVQHILIGKPLPDGKVGEFFTDDNELMFNEEEHGYDNVWNHKKSYAELLATLAVDTASRFHS